MTGYPRHHTGAPHWLTGCRHALGTASFAGVYSSGRPGRDAHYYTPFPLLPVHPHAVAEPQARALAEGGHASHKAGPAAAGVPPSTNAFTDKATSLFIAAVSADCSASSLSTAPSAHLVWVRVNKVRVKVRI